MKKIAKASAHPSFEDALKHLAELTDRDPSYFQDSIAAALKGEFHGNTAFDEVLLRALKNPALRGFYPAFRKANGDASCRRAHYLYSSRQPASIDSFVEEILSDLSEVLDQFDESPESNRPLYIGGLDAIEVIWLLFDARDKRLGKTDAPRLFKAGNELCDLREWVTQTARDLA